MNKKLPSHVKILLGMALGIVWGILSIYFQISSFTLSWIKPLGAVFINLLKVSAIPLIFASLINGIASLKDISRLSRLGLKTISLYVFTTIISITMGLVMVNIAKPGNAFPESKREEFKKKFITTVNTRADYVNKEKQKPALQFLVDVVPDNFMKATTDNSQMLQIITMAIIFGCAIVLMPSERTVGIRSGFNTFNELLLKVIDLIMLYAPIGVFALLSSMIVEFAGDNISETLSLVAALGYYSITVILGIMILLLVVYPLMVKFFSKVPVSVFLKSMLPVQMLAFSSSSSAATLPVNMEQCQNKMKVSEEVTSFVLPVGATINMDGTSLYQAIAAGFIAQAFGIDLTLEKQLTIVFTALLASIGTAPVPGAGLVMLIIVLNSVGISPEGITLILAVDRLLDMFRTVANVTSDAAVAVVVQNLEDKTNAKS